MGSLCFGCSRMLCLHVLSSRCLYQKHLTVDKGELTGLWGLRALSRCSGVHYLSHLARGFEPAAFWSEALCPNLLNNTLPPENCTNWCITSLLINTWMIFNDCFIHLLRVCHLWYTIIHHRRRELTSSLNQGQFHFQKQWNIMKDTADTTVPYRPQQSKCVRESTARLITKQHLRNDNALRESAGIGDFWLT